MPRAARLVLEDIPYHVTQRGNARQQVFFNDQDHNLYLNLLRDHSQAARLRIWAYCLMPNHIHLIAVPEQKTSLAQAMSRTNANFARHHNLRQNSHGHLWQSRFYATPLDNAHLWQAMAYVERNPVRARLVQQAENYAWSSAHLRATPPTLGLLDWQPWQEKYDWSRWKEVLRTTINEEAFGQRLHEASRQGQPLGDLQFAEDLEKRSRQP